MLKDENKDEIIIAFILIVTYIIIRGDSCGSYKREWKVQNKRKNKKR